MSGNPLFPRPRSDCTLRLRPKIAVVILVLAGTASANQIVVNDRSDSTHSPGCATTGLGTCTLRDAILFANSNSGPDTILFNIPGPGIHRIQPSTALPPLTDDAGVFIDGFTQPGSSPNTATEGCNAIWTIALDAAVFLPAPGLSLQSSHNTVRGLVITEFGPAVDISAGLDNALRGNELLISGIYVHGTARRVAIGSTDPGDRNLITGSAGGAVGVLISGSGVGEVTVAGNIVGAPSAGPQGEYRGIVISNGADHNVIGGAAAGAGNLISGNATNGIEVIAGAVDNIIQGNLIGTDPTGTTAVPNQAGIWIDASNNAIGGASPGEGNVISGNMTWGISVRGSNNMVTGNFIGVDSTGTRPLGNARNPSFGGGGIAISGPGGRNRVGGLTPQESNVVAFNGNAILGGRGVGIGTSSSDTTLSNSILGNSIHDNFGLGIDLGFDGVTPNHSCGSASGPNLLQNYPEIESVSIGRGTVTIIGRLDSRPSETYTLEFFSSRRCAPIGNGEGERFLGRASVTTGSDCVATFHVDLFVSAQPGDVVTATTTDSSGNTSEFSACTAGSRFQTITPCRLIDTRGPGDPLGGPALVAGADRTFPVTGFCGIPETAKAVSFSVAIVNPTTGPGFATVYPGNTARPLFSTINYSAGQIRANNGIIALGESGAISVFCGQGSGTADLVIDINGYFQ
jgi:hypothetical protein